MTFAYITYSEMIAGSGFDPDKARKASLVLRACGTPVVHEGYMGLGDAEVLHGNLETGAAAYDAAERELQMEERARDQNPNDPFTLPRDSHVTSSTIAHRAEQTYVVRPGAVFTPPQDDNVDAA